MRLPPGIYGFHQGGYDWLSNFYIEPDGTCVEVAYQMAKCKYAEDLKRFEGVGPAKAKAIAGGLQLNGRVRPDWFEVNLEIMDFHVRKKFRDYPELAERLALTEPLYIEETNNWHDTFWGVCNGGPRCGAHNRKGLNVLGAILMQIREDL